MKDAYDLYPIITYNAIKDDVLVDLESVHLFPEFLVFPAEQHGIARDLAAGGDQ